MTTQATPSFGYELWVEESGTTPLKKVAELLTLTPPGLMNSTQDVTTHDSTADANGRVAREKMMNVVYDLDNIEGTCHFLPAGGNPVLMRSLALSGKLMNFAIRLPVKSGTAQMITGTGYMMQWSPGEMGIEGKQEYSFAIELTGGLTFGNWVQPS